MTNRKGITDPRIFAGVFPTGISYADRTREKGGDYVRLAHLFFETLELRVEPDCPPDMEKQIREDAAKIQAMEGQDYRVSTSGQYVTLGWGKRGAGGGP